ncbi:MAG: ABC transporter permease [Acidobacteria bacterium]|nr:ABC transporter permease [Acidobacteriota bacterium]
MTRRTRTGVILAIGLAACALAAPWLAPYDPGRQFSAYPFAPPMRPHVIDAGGSWRAPFVYPMRLVDPLERRYEEDRTRMIPLRWVSGALVRVDGAEPWFALGSDALGRDVLSRVAAGARLSLGVALLGTVIALAVGAAAGAVAGYAGGWADAALMRVADLVLVLPGIYVVLALRGALPLVLSPVQVFAALVLVFSLVGWPAAARGVRGIFIVERSEEYAEAARAVGAGPMRVIGRHLLPASLGFLYVQATVLLPAFVMAEATLSYVGLGFAPPAPSWGAMLQDAGSARGGADAPWLLTPAIAIVMSVLVVQLAAPARDPLLWPADNS